MSTVLGGGRRHLGVGAERSQRVLEGAATRSGRLSRGAVSARLGVFFVLHVEGFSSGRRGVLRPHVPSDLRGHCRGPTAGRAPHLLLSVPRRVHRRVLGVFGAPPICSIGVLDSAWGYELKSRGELPVQARRPLHDVDVDICTGTCAWWGI